ncbi:MAG: hypothetical protein A2177_12480 [Spirochaetes bacterium RBG_13_68_11]|nr:MAG: hypothetical protein A2177_12480 [Spirochaetes bacterium RBG_13_68_11]
MSARLRVALVIGRRQANESLLSPGFYLMTTIAISLGCFLVAGFTTAIDSSGFNPGQSAPYELLTRALSGAFGVTFVEKLFAEGPFAFALLACALPVLLYLSIASVFRFGQEKGAGYVELLVYGPADGTSCFLAVFLKDVLLAAVSLAALALALTAAAGFAHLATGPLFRWTLLVAFLVCLPVFAYGILCSIVAANPSGALALFLGTQLVFLLVFAGSFAIVGATLHTVSSVVASVLQWASPLYYAGLCFRAIEAAQPALFAAGGVMLVVLAAALLAVAHVAIRFAGVRA